MRAMMVLVVLGLIVSSFVFGQSSKQSNTWQIVGQVNGDRVEFKCIEGCLWTLNSVTCGEIEQCRWTLDQSGILAYAKPFDYELELQEGRTERLSPLRQ